VGTMLQERKSTTTSRRDAEMRWPTAHELRAFVRLAETLHFGQTAEMLGLAQSSLSEAIRRLEAKLDVVLLERTSRHVSLTEAGTRLLPVARTILRGMVAARSAAAATPVATGTLRIGIEGPGLAELNGPVLAAVAERHPRARLIVRESLGLPQAFFDQRLDLALVRTPPDDALDVHPVATEERGLLVPPGHPAARAAAIAMDDVAGEPFVAVAPHAVATRDHWLALDERGGRTPVIGGAAHTMQEVIDAVGHLGLLTVGCRSMTRFHPLPRVAYVPVPGLAPNPLGVAVRRGEERPAVLGLVDLIRGVVGERAAEAPGITALP